MDLKPRSPQGILYAQKTTPEINPSFGICFKKARISEPFHRMRPSELLMQQTSKRCGASTQMHTIPILNLESNPTDVHRPEANSDKNHRKEEGTKTRNLYATEETDTKQVQVGLKTDHITTPPRAPILRPSRPREATIQRGEKKLKKLSTNYTGANGAQT